MSKLLSAIALRTERDVVLARQRGRDVAAALGFDRQDQIRVATATSEIARNAFRYARNGKVEFLIEMPLPQHLVIRVTDSGPGIPHLNDVFDGMYQSSTGLGKGITGTQRLMDAFDIVTGESGTTVTMSKVIPVTTPTIMESSFERLQKQLQQRSTPSPYEEIESQNQELLKTLAELRARQDELVLLNRELEDTNRGVVALYAELEERADFLRRASDLKTTFLSNMSHEFRTPLNSIMSLARMLLDDDDSVLGPEQEKQVRFIQKSAHDLSEMVNDLLDIAKVEAGKVVVRPRMFSVRDLFSALRGMLKPLLTENSSLELIFEDPGDFADLYTDEGKVSQILRNLISNAIKYTPEGEVRVCVAEQDGEAVFRVSDTGVGIAPEDQERIFEDFVQIESPLQRPSKGTGLGLPLCRKLGGLLGGSIAVESEFGKGSTFIARIPVVLPGYEKPGQATASLQENIAEKVPILVVEDNSETAFLYDTYVRGSEFALIHAPGQRQARALLSQMRPAGVLFDLYLDGEPAWSLLREITGELGLPVVVCSISDEAARTTEAGASIVLRKPVPPDTFLDALRSVTRINRAKRILLVDDNEVSRYVLRQQLAAFEVSVVEARGGRQALELVSSARPDAIFLDILMPDMSGFEVLQQLKADEATRHIPVVIHTSLVLNEAEHSGIFREAAAVLNKDPGSYAAEVSDVRRILLELGFSTAMHSSVHG